MYVANASGDMMPASQFLHITNQTSNVTIMRFNEYNAYEIDGSPGTSASSGQSLDAIAQIATQHMPKGMRYDWSGIARQQVQSGPQTIIVFAMGLLFVFLVLVAQYESLSTPFVIMMAVPLALVGAVGGIFVRRLSDLLGIFIHSKLAGHLVLVPQTSSDIYAQIGYVMLIGLAAKNAILIVEFANQLREQGRDTIDAVTHAAAERLRPILDDVDRVHSRNFTAGFRTRRRRSVAHFARHRRARRHARLDGHELGDRSGALRDRGRLERTAAKPSLEAPAAVGPAAAAAERSPDPAGAGPLAVARLPAWRRRRLRFRRRTLDRSGVRLRASTSPV